MTIGDCNIHKKIVFLHSRTIWINVIRMCFYCKFVEKQHTMKKLYTLLSATILTVTAGFSQVEIRAFENGQATGNDISGTTVMISVTSNDLIARTFNVKNVSGNGQQLKIKRQRIVEVTGWEDGLCWGPNPDPQFVGQCYPASSMNTNPWTTPNTAQMPNSGEGNMVIDITPDGAGCAHYRYYVMSGSIAVDSIDLEICSTLGINEPEPEPVGMTAYPNPANNYLSVATTGLEGTFDIRITDVLGKVVYFEEAGPQKEKLDVSNFKNGVYLVTVLDKGQIIQTRRIVVKHQ